MRKFLTVLLCMFMCSVQLLAQNRTVTGRVTDANGNPLPGASIQVKGTNTGTVSKEDGTFSVTVSDNSRTLIISSVGQATQEISVGNQSNISVSLKGGNQENLQEVVVVGYSTTTKQA